MTEAKNKYKVKEGKHIFHADKKYDSGAEIELTAEKALVHAANIELVKEPKAVETKPKAEVKADVDRKP